MQKRSRTINGIWTAVLTVLSLAWIYPIVMVVINSFKVESAISTSTAFQLPTAEQFAGLDNFASAIGSQGFLAAFFNSLVISVHNRVKQRGISLGCVNRGVKPFLHICHRISLN